MKCHSFLWKTQKPKENNPTKPCRLSFGQMISGGPAYHVVHRPEGFQNIGFISFFGFFAPSRLFCSSFWAFTPNGDWFHSGFWKSAFKKLSFLDIPFWKIGFRSGFGTA